VRPSQGIPGVRRQRHLSDGGLYGRSTPTIPRKHQSDADGAIPRPKPPYEWPATREKASADRGLTWPENPLTGIPYVLYSRCGMGG
jgi:hypothetical protein